MEEHHALGNFNAENKTELSIETGDLVMVLAKDPSGSGVCTTVRYCSIVIAMVPSGSNDVYFLQSITYISYKQVSV